MPATLSSSAYVGRFAPSPSGPLHFGSLVAALASYLDARAHKGKWLVRMEDIDPPREQAGAAHLILKALEAYGLHWDDEVLVQSKRSEAYLSAIERLRKDGQIYPCTCTRKKLQGYGGVYPGFCRGTTQTPEQAHSLRVHCRNNQVTFNDLVQGETEYDLQSLGDFIIQRKDGLFAYQIAVVVDDAYQGITHIVRGSDLLSATPWQIYLQGLLGFNTPVYAHIPVITQADGDKLSKQNHAPEIPLNNPKPLLLCALEALGLHPDQQVQDANIDEILLWAIDHWQLDSIPKVMSTPLASTLSFN